ncbi:hypothetical protein GPY51_14820 [Photorhabdus laumondii subsp. laumondii]|uniref:Photorhabdus luminescens subsp. laumondii TTO1 complete genome segment 2/17 n=2 Tax=Photorhabdus laumondii subsp. laumondii TaxID=141679 RepID=Q7N993_PHOLL|nr:MULTISPECIES: hypothetical protein [Photorhabdus]AWK40414.1 hypothetical protein A4R40_02200 [Photorhabdus laumondii subsp. laumondii]AXG41224.1 hypothetical protein PluDJC_02200 [Photorhabdus laumondii subsp. laumondii]AXG45754.1 hypothetical protein PluTT01m_02280 [Photorhabdus laumondii subsp. laumondii]KTL61157.1 hypothetical protein AA106_10145 [Photorhabdus laumondii subsp. laumondii]MCC8383174.1 hypothetical protein [Photorhabdus laumondii]
MSKENNKELLDSKINLNSTYLSKEIQRRLKQASFIFNPSQKTLNCQLNSSQIKLFSEICLFLEQDDNLDILASCIHDLWCAKYLVDNKTAMQDSITKLEIEYNLQVNFLKPYQAFTEKEKKFEKRLIKSDLSIISEVIKDTCSYDDNIVSDNFNYESLLSTNDTIFSDLMTILGHSDSVIEVAAKRIHAGWFDIMKEFYAHDERVQCQENSNIDNSDFIKNRDGIRIDLAAIYIVLMEIKYNNFYMEI